MDVDAINVRAIMMSSDVSEEEKILALAQILESIDSGHAFPQLVTDSLIAVSCRTRILPNSTELIVNKVHHQLRCFRTNFWELLHLMEMQRPLKVLWKV